MHDVLCGILDFVKPSRSTCTSVLQLPELKVRIRRTNTGLCYLGKGVQKVNLCCASRDEHNSVLPDDNLGAVQD